MIFIFYKNEDNSFVEKFMEKGCLKNLFCQKVNFKCISKTGIYYVQFYAKIFLCNFM